jgi:FkbM family methyltransferase
MKHKNDRNVVCETQLGKIIVNRNDLYIGKSIMDGGYYEIDSINSIVDFIKKTCRYSNPQLLDIGANIGTHALVYSQVSNAEVHCFEAQRAVFNMLAGTVALNGIDNVYLYNRAVSNKSGEIIEFDRPNYDTKINIGGFELIPPHYSDGGTQDPTDEKEKVETLRIDDLQLDRVAYIKIDIEGMETLCVEGLKETIMRCRPVLVIETFKTDSEKLKNMLKECNYSWSTRGVDLWCQPSEIDFD